LLGHLLVEFPASRSGKDGDVGNPKAQDASQRGDDSDGMFPSSDVEPEAVKLNVVYDVYVHFVCSFGEFEINFHPCSCSVFFLD